MASRGPRFCPLCPAYPLSCVLVQFPYNAHAFHVMFSFLEAFLLCPFYMCAFYVPVSCILHPVSCVLCAGIHPGSPLPPPTYSLSLTASLWHEPGMESSPLSFPLVLHISIRLEICRERKDWFPSNFVVCSPDELELQCPLQREGAKEQYLQMAQFVQTKIKREQQKLLDHCTMRFPMSIDILEIHKCKNTFHTHFIVKKHSFLF